MKEREERLGKKEKGKDNVKKVMNVNFKKKETFLGHRILEII